MHNGSVFTPAAHPSLGLAVLSAYTNRPAPAPPRNDDTTEGQASAEDSQSSLPPRPCRHETESDLATPWNSAGVHGLSALPTDISLDRFALHPRGLCSCSSIRIAPTQMSSGGSTLPEFSAASTSLNAAVLAKAPAHVDNAPNVTFFSEAATTPSITFHTESLLNFVIGDAIAELFPSESPASRVDRGSVGEGQLSPRGSSSADPPSMHRYYGDDERSSAGTRASLVVMSTTIVARLSEPRASAPPSPSFFLLSDPNAETQTLHEPSSPPPNPETNSTRSNSPSDEQGEELMRAPRTRYLTPPAWFYAELGHTSANPTIAATASARIDNLSPITSPLFPPHGMQAQAATHLISLNRDGLTARDPSASESFSSAALAAATDAAPPAQRRLSLVHGTAASARRREPTFTGSGRASPNVRTRLSDGGTVRAPYRWRAIPPALGEESRSLSNTTTATRSLSGSMDLASSSPLTASTATAIASARDPTATFSLKPHRFG